MVHRICYMYHTQSMFTVLLHSLGYGLGSLRYSGALFLYIVCAYPGVKSRPVTKCNYHFSTTFLQTQFEKPVNFADVFYTNLLIYLFIGKRGRQLCVAVTGWKGVSLSQWCWNEIESGGGGGHMSGAKCRNKCFCRAPPLLWLYTISHSGDWWVLLWWAEQFIVRCSSNHGVPRSQPFVKVGEGYVLPIPYGVGATDRSASSHFQLYTAFRSNFSQSSVFF